ncbi:MAG: hypothetical protein ACE5HS_11535 [bacterium]
MSKYVGVWVSHGLAKIVSLNHKGHSSLLTIESNIEKKHKSTSGSPPKTPYSHGGVAVPKYQDRVAHQLQHFYSSILTKTAFADHIYLLGPGLAKKELKNEFEKRKNLAHKIIDIEPSDKMTDAQLIAKIKARFGFKR